ncbi:MAG TPA: BTAD domain-containing putative transcriptional regulator [Gemmatimonadales bacterium]|nr:BTAD domain-containing putative transcriptional regulator [Gemmatimonadales bacterium]
MLRVLTFGRLTLQLDGTVITGVATQRRQLALLALLAVAGDDGMSREKLQGYLWPASDGERARHALNQLLYVQRRHHQAADFVAGKKTLRLPSQGLESDVQIFEAALAEGRLEGAVEVYHGPFLDGFFLDGAPSFEEWVAERRNHYAARHLGALENLADQAAQAGDLEHALEWSRRASVADPLNSRLAVAHVDSLLRCEDRAGALRALRAHCDRLQAELGISPSSRLLELEARIQAGDSTG